MAVIPCMRISIVLWKLWKLRRIFGGFFRFAPRRKATNLAFALTHGLETNKCCANLATAVSKTYRKAPEAPTLHLCFGMQSGYLPQKNEEMTCFNDTSYANFIKRGNSCLSKNNKRTSQSLFQEEVTSNSSKTS